MKQRIDTNIIQLIPKIFKYLLIYIIAFSCIILYIYIKNGNSITSLFVQAADSQLHGWMNIFRSASSLLCGYTWAKLLIAFLFISPFKNDIGSDAPRRQSDALYATQLLIMIDYVLVESRLMRLVGGFYMEGPSC